MRQMRFMVLTGHLDEFALPDLIRTLHGQRKTGRLLIEYPETPGTFYFEGGALVDAQLGTLNGLEALFVALSLPGASFNFNPLVKPPRRTVEEHERKALRELLDGPGTAALDVSVTPGGEVSPLPQASAAPRALPAPASADTTLQLRDEEDLVARLCEVETAIATHARRFSLERAAYALLIAGLLLFVGLRLRDGRQTQTPEQRAATQANNATVAPSPDHSVESRSMPAPSATLPETSAPRRNEPAVQGPQTNTRPAKRADSATPTAKAPAAADPTRTEKKVPDSVPAAEQRDYVVQVVMKVEHGRVLQAVVKNSRPGMEDYEALALRLARQRRYPDDYSGQETLRLKVKP